MGTLGINVIQKIFLRYYYGGSKRLNSAPIYEHSSFSNKHDLLFSLFFNNENISFK